MRFARALAPSPLTLPAHASLLTGLEPREHGLRDNGGARLPAEPPTLAAVFAAAGYRTGAFVASRVLDRRFGLGRGFEVYDDRMAAEQVGESGDPERDAVAVTTAALAWARGLPAGTRFFLWVHYYDAHSPYAPPAELAGDGSAGSALRRRGGAGRSRAGPSARRPAGTRVRASGRGGRRSRRGAGRARRAGRTAFCCTGRRSKCRW